MERGTQSFVARMRARLACWYRRWRSRRELARLPPHLLRDAGIRDLDARAEARKPFWRG
jgi:uncharacterized protein YjiS (DUF1127 family)